MGRKLKILFVGFLIEDKLFDLLSSVERFPQFAAQSYQKSIAEALGSIYGASLSLLSSPPVSSFPRNSRLWVGGRTWRFLRNKYPSRSIAVLNIPLFNLISRFFGILWRSIKWAMKKLPQEEKRIIVMYALHTPHLVALLLVKCLFNIKLVIFVPDLPEYMRSIRELHWFIRWMKKIDVRMLHKLVKFSDGCVVIAKQIESALPGCNTMVLDFIAKTDKVKSTSVNLPELPHGYNIMYCGGLKDEYGIAELIDIMSERYFAQRNVNLLLCGKGPLEYNCKVASEKFENIVYFGALKNTVVRCMQTHCFALINMRRTDTDLANYSFPSKIAEYLESETPIITTRLPGISKDLDCYLNYATVSEVGPLIDDMINNYKIYKSRAMAAKKYIHRSRSLHKQTERLGSFFSELFGEN